ncbi:MAG TPA: hypothetical protein VF250_14510 [Conexibacter sp.]
MSRLFRHAAAALLVCAAVVLSACGGSDKPGYCSDRSQLESSIKDLANLSPSNGISGLQSQLRQIQSDATALVASASDDFPSQTSAIERSVEALAADVRTLPSSPSASQIASLAGAASNVVGSVGAFMDASKSACD